jgi:hypothetical protein
VDIYYYSGMGQLATPELKKIDKNYLGNAVD